MKTLTRIDVSINNKIISAASYQTLSLVGDIDFIYNGGALVINDQDATLIDSSFLKIGSTIKIIFGYDNNESSIDTIEMCIHSIHQDDQNKKTYDTGGGLYIYKLISPYFYAQIPANRGYFSKTSDIINKELGLITSFTPKSKTISQSSDSFSRRYLLNERPLSFIKKISMLSNIDGSAALCFIDDFNNFKYISLDSLLKATPKVSIIAPNSKVKPTYSEGILLSAFNIRLFENLESWDSSKVLFNKVDIENNVISQSYLPSLVPTGEVNFIDSNVLSKFTFTSQYSSPTNGIIEQQSLSLQYQKDQLLNFIVEAYCFDAIGRVHAGDVIELIIPTSITGHDTEANSYSGNYIVKRCEHKIDKMKVKTELILVKPSTKPKSWTQS